MAEGKPNKPIAYEIQITEPTVKAHITEILRKLGATSRTQAVIAAQRLSLEPVPRAVAALERLTGRGVPFDASTSTLRAPWLRPFPNPETVRCP